MLDSTRYISTFFSDTIMIVIRLTINIFMQRACYMILIVPQYRPAGKDMFCLALSSLWYDEFDTWTLILLKFQMQAKQ